MDNAVPIPAAPDDLEWHPRARRPPATASAPPAEPAQIWMLDDRQLRYWTRTLGVTVYEIRDAIAATGTRCPTAVRDYLRRGPAAN